MFLITSAAYISGEFVSEIGLLPPSFLPIGNRCLYEYQVTLAEQLGHSDDIYLSIPESFVLSDYEQRHIKQHQVQLIRVPEGLSLGESVLYCLNMTSLADQPLRILHGDTLYRSLPTGEDLLSVSPNTGFYQRAVVSTKSTEHMTTLNEKMAVDGEEVISGYFAFSSRQALTQSLTRHRGHFIAALNDYGLNRPLTNVQAMDWYDFGHINSYFRSRASFTTERSFNALQINTRVVRKTSEHKEKVLGEAHWFQKLPGELQLFTPRLLEMHSTHSRAAYGLEYIYNLPLNDLFVFGRLTKEIWHSIFVSCEDFLHQCANAANHDVSLEKAQLDLGRLNALYLPKTQARLKALHTDGFCDVHAPVVFNGKSCPSPMALAELTGALIPPARTDDVSIVHGDFCFSNILYDFRTCRIKVLDPRGLDSAGEPSLLGDSRYDLAKLYHSVCGLYDLIVAGRLIARRDTDDSLWLTDADSDQHQAINAAFEDVFFAHSKEKLTAVRAITIHLFLSMLPLHNDRPDRQWSMLANAYRLYTSLKETSSCL